MIKKRHDETKKYAEAMLTTLFIQARAQFGGAVKGQWFYDGECPGCGAPINAMKFKNKDALSLNAFMYRPRGILIGYLLCGRCAEHIFAASEKKPHTQTPLHAVIEQNLTNAYLRHMASLDA